MAYYNPNRPPHITDPDALTRFFAQSQTKSHPVQLGGGLIQTQNVVVPLKVKKIQPSTPRKNARIRLVTPTEATTQRAVQDIRNRLDSEDFSVSKKRKQTTPRAKTSPKKRKARDVFND
jgi:hypothetical protein